MSLQDSLELAISEATGVVAKLAGYREVGGGCIHSSRIVCLEDGREFFVKSLPDGSKYPGMFAVESRCLTLLASTETIRVPRPVAYDADFIVLERLHETDRSHDWHEKTGRQLARLHQATRSERFGFERDNYIGLTPQPNDWNDDWVAFWRDQRISWQLELFAQKTDPDDRLLQLGDRLVANLDRVIGGVNEPAVLLHGDLWSGNAAADENGEPVIFDPAGYYGHREVEFGIMRLFGGFGPRCEAAYDEVWPREDGSEQRIALYRLYHELNHLNLFGRSYYANCIATIESLL